MPEDGGEVRAKITADTSGLKKATTEVDAESQKMVASLKTIETAALIDIGRALGQAGNQMISGMRDLVQGPVNYAEEIKRAAAITGMGVEEIQRWRFAATQSESSAEALNAALFFYSDLMGNAATGDKTATEMLAKYGITAKDTSAGMAQLIQKMEAETDATKRSAMAKDLLGRGAKELIPLLTKGEAGIKALFAEGAGTIMSREQVEALDRAGDNLTKLNNEMMITKGAIAEGLLPAFEALGKISNAVLEPIGEFFKEHKGLAATLGFAILIAAGAMVVLGTVTKAYIGLIFAKAAALKMLAAAQWLFNAAAYANPYVLIALAVVGAAALFGVFKGIEAMVTSMESKATRTPAMPEMPKMAAGGSFLTRGPTVFMAGERGSEMVNVTPLRGGGGASMGTGSINITVNAVVRDVWDWRSVGRQIAEVVAAENLSAQGA